MERQRRAQKYSLSNSNNLNQPLILNFICIKVNLSLTDLCVTLNFSSWKKISVSAIVDQAIPFTYLICHVVATTEN